MIIDQAKAKKAGGIIRNIAVEIETLPTVEKIDWASLFTNFGKLLEMLLPLILAFLASKTVK